VVWQLVQLETLTEDNKPEEALKNYVNAGINKNDFTTPVSC
jgi:hypothetical protein